MASGLTVVSNRLLDWVRSRPASCCCLGGAARPPRARRDRRRRALGMGGAFVAVADDASRECLEPGRPRDRCAGECRPRRHADDRSPRSRRAGPGAAPGGPGALRGRRASRRRPVLLPSDARCGHTAAPAGPAGPGRQDTARGRIALAFDPQRRGQRWCSRSRDFLVVGRHREVRTAAAAPRRSCRRTSVDAALDQVDDLERHGRDDGATSTWAPWRPRAVPAGLVGEEPGGAPRSDRDGGRPRSASNARCAVGAPRPGTGVDAALVVAVDADLDAVPRRRATGATLAVGGERWLAAAPGRPAGRAAGPARRARPVASGGASVAVKTGVFVDGHVAAGPDGAERSSSPAAGWCSRAQRDGSAGRDS